MDSAYAKLGRAKTHYSALNDSIEGWRARVVHKWSVSATDHLFDKSQAIIKVHLHLSEDPPSDWGLIIGDMLTNLRAALDHSIVSHAASRQQLTSAQERKLSFPILLDSDRWLGAPAVPATKLAAGRAKIESAHKTLVGILDPAVLAVVEQSQPYHMSPPEEHALAGLNELVNLDKHRAVRVVTYVYETFELKQADLDVLAIDAPTTPISNGAVVATLRVRRRSVDDRSHLDPKPADFHFTNSSYEALELPSAGFSEEVRHVMRAMIEQVEEILHCLKAVGC